MGSKAQTVTLPTKFLRYVDGLVDKEEYGSRADFVHKAIEFYRSFIFDCLAKYYRRYDEYAKLRKQFSRNMDDTAFVKQVVLKYWKDFDMRNYDGDKTTVMIRIPPQRYEEISYLVETKKYYDSRQDFYRQAIEYYVDIQDCNAATWEAIKADDLNSMKELLPHPGLMMDLYLSPRDRYLTGVLDNNNQDEEEQFN